MANAWIEPVDLGNIEVENYGDLDSIIDIIPLKNPAAKVEVESELGYTRVMSVKEYRRYVRLHD